MAAVNVTSCALIVATLAVLCIRMTEADMTCRTKWDYNSVWSVGPTHYIAAYRIANEPAYNYNCFDVISNYHGIGDFDAIFIEQRDGETIRTDINGAVDQNSQYVAYTRSTPTKKFNVFKQQIQEGIFVAYTCVEGNNYILINYDIDKPELAAVADRVAYEMTKGNPEPYKIKRIGC